MSIQSPASVPQVRRRLTRRQSVVVTTIVVAAVLGLGIRAYLNSLTAEEAGLVGTWDMRDPATPDKPGKSQDQIRLNSNRSISFPFGPGPEGYWKVADGRLTVVRYDRTPLDVFGVRLPWKTPFPVSWKIVRTADADRIGLNDVQQPGRPPEVGPWTLFVRTQK